MPIRAQYDMAGHGAVRAGGLHQLEVERQALRVDRPVAPRRHGARRVADRLAEHGEKRPVTGDARVCPRDVSRRHGRVVLARERQRRHAERVELIDGCLADRVERRPRS